MWLADCERSSIAGLGLACAYDLRDQGARVSDLPAFSASAALGDPSPPVGSGAAGVSAGPPPVPGGRGSVVFPPAVPPIALPASFAPGVTMDALGASDGVAGTGGAAFGEVGPACVFTAGGGAFSHALESIAIAAMPASTSFWTRLLLFLREHRSTGTWIVPTLSSPRISGSGTCIDRRRVPRDFRAGAGRPATRWRSRSQVDLFGRRPHNATCRVLDFDQNPNVVYLHPASKATPKVEGLSPSTDQELPERAAGRILTGRARRMSSCLTT